MIRVWRLVRLIPTHSFSDYYLSYPFSPFLIKNKNKSKWNVTYSHRSDRWIFCRATLKSVEGGKKKNIWTSSVRVCDGKENLWRDPAAHFCLGIDLTVASRTKYGRAGPLSVSPARADRTDMFSTHPSHVQLFTSFMKSNRAAAATIVRNSRLSVNCCSLSLFLVSFESFWVQSKSQKRISSQRQMVPCQLITFGVRVQKRSGELWNARVRRRRRRRSWTGDKSKLA